MNKIEQKIEKLQTAIKDFEEYVESVKNEIKQSMNENNSISLSLSELISGEWYSYKDSCFRYSHHQGERIFCKSFVLPVSTRKIYVDHSFIAGPYPLTPTTKEKIVEALAIEEENGWVWSNEKGNFLFLEDVKYSPRTLRDIIDINNIEPLGNIDFVISKMKLDDYCIGLEDDVVSMCFLGERKEVNKLVFKNLLKIYKG